MFVPLLGRDHLVAAMLLRKYKPARGDLCLKNKAGLEDGSYWRHQ